MIHALGTTALYVATAAAVVFVLAYQLTARWWRSAEGWHLMSFTGAFALILAWLSWRTFVGEPQPVSASIDLIRTLIYCGVAVLFIWRFWLLGRRQIWAPWRRRPKKGS